MKEALTELLCYLVFPYILLYEKVKELWNGRSNIKISFHGMKDGLISVGSTIIGVIGGLLMIALELLPWVIIIMLII